MSLEEQLAGMREASAGRVPTDKRAVMKRATDDLQKSGIIERAIKIGDTLPDFSLRNAYGVDVHAADLLSQGPVVLSVFRGTW
ncbi:MAG: hypothetical protein JKY20_04230 [Alphaproteobacteria bacterium]|nr:hypothetical protein [Alphaproteobacteria bacterium]